MGTTEKFTGKADIYAKSRPAYPNEYLLYLASECGLKQSSVIADIGAGTGILTGQLLESGYAVIAVEPNDDMRQTSKTALGHYPRLRFVKGTAEHTGLDEKSVDLITVAQAFHWFDKEKFKQEAKRVLKPEGMVSLVWNERDPKSGLVLENADICKNFCPDFTGFSGGIGDMSEICRQFFKDGSYEYKSFENDLEFDLNGFIGRNLSSSYAPKKEDQQYQGFLSSLTGLFEKHSRNGKLIMPNRTSSYLGYV